MGTKMNPGEFDCYANAELDEPMFVLLGRDKDAPDLVDDWAARRERAHEDPAKVREAIECAASMRRYRERRIEARCRALAPEIAQETGLTVKDAEALLRVLDADADKARRAATLVKFANVPVSVITSAIDLAS